jgi:purine-nucleoside phosphorylase
VTSEHPASRTDPSAARAAHELATLTGVARHDVAVVLGSGWGAAADELGPATAETPVAALPGFAPPAVAGHGGSVRSVPVGDRHALVFLGRTHLYEGHGVAAVAHPVRTAAAAGCRQVVLTNGCGGLDPAWAPGTVVLISDHLNLTGVSPLTGPRFVDLTDLYSSRLRALAREADPSLPEGVYAQLPGPHYETPAEIRMLGRLGADLVGMSTALEAIAARAEGVEVLGLSLVTNAAAGVTGTALDHGEVLAEGRRAARRLGRLLGVLLGRLLGAPPVALPDSP